MKSVKAYRPVKPDLVYELNTGVVVACDVVEKYFIGYINDLHKIVTQLLSDEKLQTQTLQNLSNLSNIKAQEAGRQLNVSTSQNMPKRYPQPYRSLKLVRDNYITSLRSYQNRLHHNEGKPSAGRYINYGACDKQVTATQIRNNNIEWTVLGENNVWWVFVFQAPKKLLTNTTKITQPILRVNKNNELCYQFCFEYQTELITTTQTLGVDIGKIRPYVASLIDENNEVVAIFEASPQTLNTNKRKTTTQKQLNDIHKKIDAYKKLGLIDKAETLQKEANKKRLAVNRKEHSIAKETGVEVAKLSKEHKATIVLENLSWLNSKGGKWKHSITQHWVTHKTGFAGTKTLTINPANTSKTCPNCQKVLTTTAKRTIKCVTCNKKFDRDIAASIEIGRRGQTKKGKPTPKRPPKLNKKLSSTHSGVPLAHGVQAGSVSQSWVIKTQHQNTPHSHQTPQILYKKYRI